MLTRSLRAWILTLAAFAATGPASATFALRPELPPEIERVEPAAGHVLPGGGIGHVGWLGADEFRPGGFVEWEAFLSLDGGRTYPYRITPHLDITVRRLAFRVPDLPTRTARLLLRFGDGRQEIAVALPHDFIITPPMLPASELTVAARGGEPATPLMASVSSWVEGTPEGRNLIRHRAAHAHLGVEESALLSRAAETAALEEDPSRPSPQVFRTVSLEAPRHNGAATTRRCADPALPQVPPLLRTNRRNE